ncbi:hypothetical protein GCM10020000_00270 [Streptomyces olivoverticillatus]
MRAAKTATLLAVAFTTGLASGFATAHASAPPTAMMDVTLTNTDNGRTVTVRTGDGMAVRLTGSRSPGATWAWSVPTAGDSTTLNRTTAFTTSDGSATASFRVERPGTTGIEAYQRCLPDPGHVCAHVVILWKVTVTVK